MKLKKLIIVSSLLLGLCEMLHAQNHLVTYPAPQEAELKNDFTVKVRQPGKEWQDVATYPVKVDEVRNTKHNVEIASMGYFDFEGEVEVSVTSNNGNINTGRVRPLSYKISPQIDGNTLTFKLNSPPQLVDRSQRRHLSQPSPLRQSDRPEQSAETGHEPEEVEKGPQPDLFRSGHAPVAGRYLECSFGQDRVHCRRSHRERLHPSGKRTGCEGFRKRGSTPRRPWGRYQNHQFQKHRGRRRYDHAMPHRWLGQRDDTQRKGYQLLRMG